MEWKILERNGTKWNEMERNSAEWNGKMENEEVKVENRSMEK